MPAFPLRLDFESDPPRRSVAARGVREAFDKEGPDLGQAARGTVRPKPWRGVAPCSPSGELDREDLR